LGTLLDIVLIAFLIVANGLFSASETAVVSSRRARLQQRAESGDEGARRALELSNDPNVFLATGQIGITLIGVLSGAFGGAALSKPVAHLLDHIPGVAGSSESIAFVVVVLVITYLSLVVGELAPKRIALNNPEGIAALIAAPMQRLSRIVGPVVSLLGLSTDLILRVLRVRKNDEPAVTEEEVGILLRQGTRAGVFHPAEQAMTERIFDLADDRVSALMTPRPEIDWIDIESSPEEIARTIHESQFSRFPVARGGIDHVEGTIQTKDVLIVNGDRWTVALPAELPKPLILPESTSALHALERFRQTGDQMGIVIDEYGGTAGIITLQDILEAIVGDLPDPGEKQDAGIVRRADGSWLLDGRLQIDDVCEVLGLPDLPDEHDGSYETLAGFVIAQFGNLPASGDRTTWGGWIFEVIDMDGRRVDKILAMPEPGPDGDAPANS
jgi:putative hemolysin